MNPPEDFDPPAGQAQTLAPGLQRILAPNPSAMTWRGTNTYLVGTRNLAVIDPGPSDPAHLQAIVNSLRPGQSISHILVTHAHLDHSPLAADLARETGAPILAYGDALAGRSAVMQGLAESGMAGGGEGVDHSFRCDIALADGACVQGDGWQITAHWTPGHFGNHLAFQWGDAVFFRRSGHGLGQLACLAARWRFDPVHGLLRQTACAKRPHFARRPRRTRHTPKRADRLADRPSQRPRNRDIAGPGPRPRHSPGPGPQHIHRNTPRPAARRNPKCFRPSGRPDRQKPRPAPGPPGLYRCFQNNFLSHPEKIKKMTKATGRAKPVSLNTPSQCSGVAQR